MKIKPLNKNILIRKEEVETITAGGLHIPKEAQENTQRAKVIALGTGAPDFEFSVKVGDTVILFQHAFAQSVKVGEDDSQAIVLEDEIIAIIED